MKEKLACALAALSLLTFIGQSQTLTLDWVKTGSSGSAEGGGFSLSSTAGQAEPGSVIAGGEFSLGSGFWSFLLDSEVGVSSNLLNGEFESGFRDFSSDYLFVPEGGSTAPGEFGVGTNATSYDPNLGSFGDHTTGSGKMMVVEGSSQVPAQAVWQATLAVSPNQAYRFSAWAAAASDSSRPVLQLAANGIPVAPEQQLTEPVGTWQKLEGIWDSGQNTAVTLSIRDVNTSATGNDFGLDDIQWVAVSELRIVSVHRSGTDLVLEHTSNNGHWFALQSTSGFINGPWVYIAGTTNLGTGALVHITLKDALNGPSQFYRVQQIQ